MSLVHPSGRFDNSPAAGNRRIEVIPLAAAMGAEIRGVSIASLDDEAFAEVEAALFRHKMIYFRRQTISHAEQAAFSARFGPFAEDAYTQGVPGFPQVQPLVKEADQTAGMVFGAGWHTDSPFLARPPAISMLYAIEVPPWGGDTIWANSALAYATLSPAMQRIVDPLRVWMSMGKVVASAQAHQAPDESPLGRVAATKGEERLPAEIARKVAGAFHPLVRTHPATGEKGLYCDEVYACGLEGLTAAEAEPLLAFLVRHITQPAFTCRLRWEAGTYVCWDNRLCVHQAFNDYDGFRRELYRTTIAGETPS